MCAGGCANPRAESGSCCESKRRLSCFEKPRAVCAFFRITIYRLRPSFCALSAPSLKRDTPR
eukprot:1011094-Prymnesium_polylepis.1